EARARAARALAVRELLIARADFLGISVGEDLESRVQALIEREVRTPKADEATCRRFYEANQRRFRSSDLVEARHILFPADPGDEAAIATACAKAGGAIDILNRQPERFAELANELSACPSAKQGGNLGQLSCGSTVPEVETFLFELEEGQLCPVPVRSRYGFHVLRVERRVNGRSLPFETVQKKIADYLEERVWRPGLRQYIPPPVRAAELT